MNGRGKTLRIADAHLYYEEGGKRAQEAVVFIHGFTLNARMWDPQWRALGKHYRTVRYDVRGFGRSSRADGPHDPAADLLALLDHLGIQRAHLVGLSMGANIALNFAVRHPQRVLKVVAASPNVDGFSDYTPALFSAFGQVFGAVAQRGWTKETQDLWLDVPLLRLQETAPAAHRSLVEQMVRNYSGDQFANPTAAPQYGQPPTAERLGELNSPILVIVGEKDEESIQRIARLIAQKAPNAQQFSLTGAGHLNNLEQPSRFNQALRQFLSEKK